MPVEPGDDEDRYFQERDQESRRKLREKLQEQAQTLEEQQKIAQSVETDDAALAERIKQLGFDGDSARIFDLMPLVHVAWADGKIQRKERAAILRILETRGIHPGTEAFSMMESLLEERPSDAYMKQSLEVLRQVTGGLSDRAQSIVDMCIEVAASSGGMLGLGKRIGDDEKAQIAEIVSTLGDTASDQFRKDLG